MGGGLAWLTVGHEGLHFKPVAMLVALHVGRADDVEALAGNLQQQALSNSRAYDQASVHQVAQITRASHHAGLP